MIVFIFALVIFKVFRYINVIKKNIPHRDCSETVAISKYVSNTAFLYEIYSENTLRLALHDDS